MSDTRERHMRMPGFGDLPGDDQNPNSPDYIEPAFGLDDAEANVALMLHRRDEVTELVYVLAESRALLNWIASNVPLPAHLGPRFRMLDDQSKRLRELVDAEYEALNAPTGEEYE